MLADSIEIDKHYIRFDLQCIALLQATPFIVSYDEELTNPSSNLKVWD
jgi:hypothetical protein